MTILTCSFWIYLIIRVIHLSVFFVYLSFPISVFLGRDTFLLPASNLNHSWNYLSIYVHYRLFGLQVRLETRQMSPSFAPYISLSVTFPRIEHIIYGVYRMWILVAMYMFSTAFTILKAYLYIELTI